MTTLLDKIFGTYLGIEFKDDSVVLTYLKNTISGITLLSTSSFPVRYDEEVPDGLRQYIAQHSIGIHKIFVSLPDNWGITKFIDIPSMKGKGKGTLANLMKFEIERHIPFEIDDVAYDFMVLDEKDMSNSVVFVAVQKERLDRVKGYLEKLSIQPHAITTSSFAVLNSIELGGGSAGGWQDIIGIVRKSQILGRKGETNLVIYLDKMSAFIAVVIDGLCSHLRSFSFDASRELESSFVEMFTYLADLQSSLSLEQYNHLVIAGDVTSNKEFDEGLNRQINEGMISVKKVERFSGKLHGVEMNGLSPSIGACFGGLGIGTYRINLLPHKTDYEIRKIAPWGARIFLVIIVLLIIGIFTTETVKQKRFLSAIDERIRKNEPEVKSLEKLLSEINSLKDESEALTILKNDEITLEILAELAGIMPSDAWVTTLDYKGIDLSDRKKTGSEVIISGYASSSSVLIPILEDSPYFEKVEFVGPIKKTQDKEQFKLSAKIVRPAEGSVTQ